MTQIRMRIIRIFRSFLLPLKCFAIAGGERYVNCVKHQVQLTDFIGVNGEGSFIQLALVVASS